MYSPTGVPLGPVFPARALGVAWQEGTISGASFSVPKTATLPVYDRDFLGDLNRFEWHCSVFPVAWTGVVLDQEADATDHKVTCVGSEWLYTGRLTDEWDQMIGYPGELIAMLHQRAVGRQPVGIVPGLMERGGAEYYALFENKYISDALAEVASYEGGTWWVEKRSHAHADLPRLRYAQKRGRDLSGSVLLCGEVVDVPGYKRSAAAMATAILALGIEIQGLGRLREYLPDPAGVRKYGLRERLVENSAWDTIEVLHSAAVLGLQSSREPARTPALNIDNRGGAFGSFWLGDTVRVILPTVQPGGLDAKVRVTGIQYDGDAGKLGLTCMLVEETRALAYARTVGVLS